MSGSNEPITIDKGELAALIASAIQPVLRSNAEVSEELLRATAEIKSTQDLTNDRLAQAMKTIENHDHMLRGNGRVGLITRMETVEGNVDSIRKSVEDMIAAIRGSDDKPGVIGRLTSLEGRVESMSRPMWIVLSTLIGVGVTLAVSHFIGQ